MHDIFDRPFPYSKDDQIVPLQAFHKFLFHDQNDILIGKDIKTVSNFISDFVQDPQRDIQEPYLTISEVRSLTQAINSKLVSQSNFYRFSLLISCFQNTMRSGTVSVTKCITT